ncbi:MAG: Hpt domain-containing protein [Acidobacteriaceae bacterium]|nr:Hpt domain-containing protein [Acidobacteriaceae bacterium]
MMDPNFEDETRSMQQAIWKRYRPVVLERLELLDRAGAVARTGALSEELHAEAASVAHKLAGSLGMYGYDEGTRIAREIEVLLDNPVPASARLWELATELRSSVFPVV